jgi:hypothetical protein
MDVSGLPGMESVSCFWTGSKHAQEWILPTIMENYIEESLHKQEFSIDYPSQRWSFPMIPPKKVFSDGVLSTNLNFPFLTVGFSIELS